MTIILSAFAYCDGDEDCDFRGMDWFGGSGSEYGIHGRGEALDRLIEQGWRSVRRKDEHGDRVTMHICPECIAKEEKDPR